ncbi:MAG: DUF2752 domain-containing protein [Jatrophihabitantaceae bacterium]
MAAAARAQVRPAVVAGLLAAAVLEWVNPNTTHVPLCPLHAMTGLWCPLCGSLRAGFALLHGQLGTAAHDNLLFVVGLPLLMLLWARSVVHGGTDRLLPRWAYWSVVAIGLAYGVLRNLPAGSWLAPPA